MECGSLMPRPVLHIPAGGDSYGSGQKTRSKQGLPYILCAEAHKSAVIYPVNKCININYVLLLLFTFSIDYRIDKDQQRRIVFQQGEEGVYTKIYAKKTR